ncbi:division/cell wall cluster transcriptional repressor MraZ [Montanilutibacter psychrotolerans]|uniref:Transcriptional regulator MraZ n=1 Tax=Montanilutibacter psychrotolerans TaxID=1327343 RepID=A0A3M8SU27_9GAMM|nr:division/cell wall cluster transcriptional repressor MraZ [Lysobacter psychrotolerans]RNF84293.1 transcriptional regulator MraZ [Lysobacter psychrotolerans]
MFQGETAITIDEKGRMAVPTAYRDLVARDCGNRLVITYNPFEAGSLYLYPLKVWERVRDQVNALPKVKSTSRVMQLKLVGAAEFVEPDGNGRFTIPASHRGAVGIERKAVLLGMGEKFELWSEQAHHEQIRQVITDADLSDELLDLQL